MSSDAPSPTGARYGRPDAPSASAMTGDALGPERECLSCGRDVPPAVARVAGDNDGNVEACRHCHHGVDGGPLKSTTRTAVRAKRDGRLTQPAEKKTRGEQ